MVFVVRPGKVPEKRKISDHIGRIAREEELTKQLEVVFCTVKLVEAYVRLDGDTRARIAQVRVAARDDGKPFAFGLPREVGDGI